MRCRFLILLTLLAATQPAWACINSMGGESRLASTGINMFLVGLVLAGLWLFIRRDGKRSDQILIVTACTAVPGLVAGFAGWSSQLTPVGLLSLGALALLLIVVSTRKHAPPPPPQRRFKLQGKGKGKGHHDAEVGEVVGAPIDPHITSSGK